MSGKEECISIPYLVANIERHNKINVEYLNLQGEYVQEDLEGFHARVFMHEYDHLDGVLMTSFSVNFGSLEVKDSEHN